MGRIAIILRRPPYGTVDAAEAIRHAMGGVVEEMEAHLVLVDGGVNAARKGQDPASTGYASIEEGVSDCIDMGVTVTAEKESLNLAGLDKKDVIDGVNILGGPDIAAIIRSADTTMIF